MHVHAHIHTYVRTIHALEIFEWNNNIIIIIIIIIIRGLTNGRGKVKYTIVRAVASGGGGGRG